MGRERAYEGVRAGSQTTIEIDFYFKGERCKERLKLQPTPANLKRAALHRAAILDAIERGEFDYSVTFPRSKNAKKFAANTTETGQELTLSVFLAGWLERMKPLLHASTWEDYKRSIAVISKALGETPLGDLSRSQFRELASGLTCGNKRIANLISPIRAALNEATTDGLIDSNPLEGWSYRKVEIAKEDSDVDPFSLAEQVAILNALTGQAKNLVQFAFWTGLRPSEYVALDWSDIDFKKGVVRVMRGATQAAIRRAKKEGTSGVEPTKTRSGRREVKLLPPALDALQDQKAYTFHLRGEVFQNPNTRARWSGDQAIRKGMWIPALERAGVRYRRPYQARHTYASMMLSAGEEPMWVASQMGHADWGMIRQIYGKWMPDVAPAAGQKAAKLFIS